jgi:hypothetical protein
MRPSTRIALLAALVVAVAPACSSDGEDAPRETVASPTFSPAEPLRFRTSLEVAMATTTPGAAIHYTMDGSAPTGACPVCTGPIAIEATTTLRAMATHAGMGDSAAASITYVQRAVDLVRDDGWWRMGMLNGSVSLLLLNRFTPSAEDFPFQLKTIAVYPWPGMTPVGTPLRLLVYTDTDGDPSNGASLEGVYDVEVLASEWSEYVLPAPLTFRDPTDVLIGLSVVDRQATWVFFDGSPSAGRTWLGSDLQDPAVLPALSLYPGNFMIRGSN